MTPGLVLETPVRFECEGDTLVGMIHPCERPSRLGVLIVVGGPQYRAGSHRQFVLLSRALAEEGVPVFRFDYRGMGDSGGEPRSFHEIKEDIAAAIATFKTQLPGLEAVVLWGLCDGASAAALQANAHPEVRGLVLLNPWVHSEAVEAKVRLKTYYLQRLRSPDLWRKILSLDFNWRDSFFSLWRYLGAAIATARSEVPDQDDSEEQSIDDTNYINAMLEALERFDGQTAIVLSGDDLVAGEFRELCKSDEAWGKLLNRNSVACCEIAAANHTFASAEWREQVQTQTCQWIKQWGSEL